MFYTKEILTKQGQFAEIWLAAHWTKKLTKQKVFQMDIKKSVGTALNFFFFHFLFNSFGSF